MQPHVAATSSPEGIPPGIQNPWNAIIISISINTISSTSSSSSSRNIMISSSCNSSFNITIMTITTSVTGIVMC